MDFTDEELEAELVRRKRQLGEKRKLDEVNVAAEKRARLLLELSEINLEMSSGTATSSSSSFITPNLATTRRPNRQWGRKATTSLRLSSALFFRTH